MAAGPGAENGNGRAKAFATAINDVVTQLVDESDIGLQPLLDEFIHCGQIILNQRVNGLDIHGA